MRRAVLVVVTLAFVMGAAASEAGFATAVNYGVGRLPYFVAIGDVNSDGKPDLVVVNESTGNVSILLGNGDGTFQAAVNYGVRTGPVSAAIGDFNGDGRQDLAVANNGSSTVSILLGNGDGTFQTAVDYEAGVGSYSIAAGDFNEDGKQDLAVADLGDEISILLGNGNGTFQTAINYAGLATPTSLVVGDFNADGNQDLAVSNVGSNSVAVLLGNGTGTFQAAMTYPVGSLPRGLAIGDFNRDDKQDLAVADGDSNNLSLLQGNGDGTFQAATNYAMATGAEAVVVGDFNGDRKQDLAIAIPSANVSIAFGNGDGTFQVAVNYAIGAPAPPSIAVGDFDRNGTLDLASANAHSNNVSVLLNDACGTSTVLSSSTNPSSFGQAVTLSATVTSGAGGCGTPMGTVMFQDGTTVLGSIVLANGLAALTTSALSIGSHSITAAYDGGGAFAGSISDAITQTVNPAQADLSITKTDERAAAVAGQPITYMIVVANAGPSPVTGATVVDTVPSAITGASWTCAGTGGGSCSGAGGGNITESVGLPAGASVAYTLSGTISPSAAGSVTNTASVAAPGGVTDPVPGNNAATDTDPLVTPGPNNETPSSAKDVEMGATSADSIGTAPNDQNWFRYHVQAGRSYCVEVDNGGTDTSIRDTLVSVYGADATTLIGVNDNVDDEPGASLLSRVCYIATATEDGLANVTSGTSGAPGGFRLRVVETTLFCPWLGPVFSGSGFESFILIKNTTGTAHEATVTLTGSLGAPVGIPQNATVPRNGNYNLQVSAAPPIGFGLSGSSASVLIAHDGPPGALVANVTTLNFGSGLSYDTPLVPRLEFRP